MFVRRALIYMILCATISACAGVPHGVSVGDPNFQPRPGQGQYVRPEWMNPAATPRIPAADPCSARLYQTLVGVPEGAIYLPGLPGEKRIVRPAVFEGPENDFLNGEMMGQTYVQVQTYLAGQQIYAPSLGSVTDRITIRPEIDTRLTITLDREGVVQEIACG